MFSPIFKNAFLAGIVALGACAAAATAQNYPNKTIRILTADPGGGADFEARLYAQALAEPLGQPVVVENRGGNLVNNVQPLINSPADGYTLLLQSSGIWLVKLLQENVPYDPVTDLAPVIWTTTAPNVLVISALVPANSVQELIALAKAKPGTINFATGGNGSSNHLVGELFKSMAGINIVRVPYKGTGQAMNDIISGKVQMMMPTLGVTMPLVKAGKLKLLAVTTPQPSQLAPDVPTMAASGLPGFEASSIESVFARAGTPVAIINRLNQEIKQVLSKPDIKDRLTSVNVEVKAGSPAELAAQVKSEMVRWGKVIKDAGIKGE